MKLVRHPNIVQLYEVILESSSDWSSLVHIVNIFWDDIELCIQVMASKSKIYFVLEYVRGGELFKKIVSDQNFTLLLSSF